MERIVYYISILTELFLAGFDRCYLAVSALERPRTPEVTHKPDLYVPPSRYSVVPDVNKAEVGDLVVVHPNFSARFGSLTFRVEQLTEVTGHPIIRVQDKRFKPSYYLALPTWAYRKISNNEVSSIRSQDKHIVAVFEGHSVEPGLYCFFPRRAPVDEVNNTMNGSGAGFGLRIQDSTADQSEPVLLSGREYKIVRHPDEPLEQYLVDRLPGMSPRWRGGRPYKNQYGL